jgi:hypothetical protein
MQYVASRNFTDCAIAALSMLTNMPYDRIAELALKTNPNVFNCLSQQRGLSAAHIQNILNELKFPFKCYEGSYHLDLFSLQDALIGIRMKYIAAVKNIQNVPEHMGQAVIWNSKKKCFWCPTYPPLSFIKSLYPKNRPIKNYYKSLNQSMIDTFFIFEKSI